ncbi:MAG: hypothetical protein RLZZ437_386 [Pseudomonadota bacterium]|jgi:hypothetical protein
MLGLLGLLGAMFAGIMGDSVMNQNRSGADDDDVDAPPADPQDLPQGPVGDLFDLPALQPDAPAPEPEVFLPPEELPGDGPVEQPDPASVLLIGTDDAEALTGGDGHDGLLGSGGADDLFGGDGNDALVGADDDDADQLFGGHGNDSLTLGAGDTATGGLGEDLFTLADFGPNTPPSVISDYSAEDDHIVLMYDPDIHPEPVVSTEVIAGTEDMSVLLDGVQIAVVQGALGLTGADIQLLAA